MRRWTWLPSLAGSASCSVWMALGAAALTPSGCTKDSPNPVVASVSPSEGYNDSPVVLSVTGEGFRPVLAVSASSGAIAEPSPTFEASLVGSDGSVQLLADLQLQSASSLTAKVPEGLAQGTYALQLSDDRGRRVLFPEAFTSRGPDMEPPVLKLLAPTSRDVFSEDTVVFRFAFSDPTSPLRLNLKDNTSLTQLACTTSPCDFAVAMPSLDDDQASIGYTITATAQDGRGNFTSLDFSFLVLHRPFIDDVSPQGGPVAGGTSFVVTGSWLPADGQILFDDRPLIPDGGERSPDGRRIRGWTPAHPPGPATVKLKSVAGEVSLPSFSFNPRPILKAAVPPSLPSSGCYQLRLVGNNFPADARWFMGPSIQNRLPLPQAALDPLAVQATFCVGAIFDVGEGKLALFVDSDSAGSAELANAFLFELPGAQPVTAPACPCP